jgi:tetratricopeptide (TPR) repeat protein
MTYVGLARQCAIGFLLCVSLNGCLPDSQSDEKKEPNFIAGKNLVMQMDYQGAVESVEKSLEVNPRSASAHFELGWLYEGKVTPPDPAAAIFHYERFLRYSSNPDKAEADLARQQVNICKLELAKTVSALGPLPSPVMREMDRVLTENKDLENRLAALQTQLDEARAAAARAQTPAPAPVAPPQNPTPIAVPAKNTVDLKRSEPPRPAAVESGGPSASYRAGHTTSFRIYTIRQGDTPAAIARKYGISIASLLAANPSVKPTHLLVGQTLNIPSP